MSSKVRILTIMICLITNLALASNRNVSSYITWSKLETNVWKYNDVPFNTIVPQSNFLKFLYPIPGNSSIEDFSLNIKKESVLDLSKIGSISSDYTYNYSIQKSREAYFLVVEILPIREQMGRVNKLESFEIDYRLAPKPIKRSIIKNRALTTSVLNNGNWYKIAVDESGVYKIDKTTLDSMGINTASIDPRDIRIYGTEGKMLPEANVDARQNSLVEQAIEVVGESDGSFDTEDYILFYGDDPHDWELDTLNDIFTWHQNLYSKYNYYFITTDLGSGKRIGSQSSSLATTTKTVTSFDARIGHESETQNFLESGKDFYGESFGISTTQTFSFDVPNLNSSKKVRIKSRAAGRSVVNAMTMKAYYDNAQVLSMPIPRTTIDYASIYARVASDIDSFDALAGNNLAIEMRFNKSSSSDEGWLDYINITAPRDLTFTGSQEAFLNINSADSGAVSNFIVNGAVSDLRIWDITDLYNVKDQSISITSGVANFKLRTDTLKEFVMFDGTDFKTPKLIGSVSNQNIHGIENKEYIIVAHKDFLTQADELGQIHKDVDDLEYVVVDQEAIFNEFSSGRKDPTAIRDFLKYLYDQSAVNGTTVPKYLLLFGDGTYDPLGHQTEGEGSFIMTYESAESVNPVSTYVTDDYFALLDDGEGTNLGTSNAGLLDIGVGRFPVTTQEDANTMIAKVRSYLNASFGAWRNNITFVADDEDNNIHLNDADAVANTFAGKYPYMNLDKIYFDAYPQVNAAGGDRYPAVQDAINAKIFDGSFIINYTGHGGEAGWAHERVLGLSDINSWDNLEKLPLFMTATCEFSRYDDPGRVSAGEQVLLSSKGGSIALMTTVRLVYSAANQNLATNFYNVVFEPDSNGNMQRLGDIVRVSKNNAANGENNRKFTLLGDPALKLNYPKHRINVTEINNSPINPAGDTVIVGTDTSVIHNDTLAALAKVEICGSIINGVDASKMTTFNGVVYPTIFDKPLTISTLANDEASRVKAFDLQQNVVYSGKATVTSGDFCFDFIVPKDISYDIGYGKVSVYADNGSIDATGYYDSIFIGGTATNFAVDNEGPEMQIFMNDENFAFGGLTDENPVLIIKITDSSGINTVGNSIGHDLSFQMNDDLNRVNLNNFYESDLDSYQSGQVQYPLNNLEEGKHTITAKAWDVHNNSSESYTEFIVAESAEIALSHVLNYPNPFTTSTRFFFEHNRPSTLLNLKITIYSVSGKIVKVIERDIMSDGYLVTDTAWDGKDDFGDDIGNGAYIYKLELSEEGTQKKAAVYQKLVILK